MTRNAHELFSHVWWWLLLLLMMMFVV